jgi:hypothetical protein
VSGHGVWLLIESRRNSALSSRRHSCLDRPAIAKTKKPINLPSGKVLLAPAAGDLQTGVGSFPMAIALSPNHRYLAILDGGFGRPEHQLQQGIGVLDLATNKITFHPDARLGNKARQTYFLVLLSALKEHKLFFFVNYEGVRQSVGTPVKLEVLNDATRALANPANAGIQAILHAIPHGNGGPVLDPKTGLPTLRDYFFGVLQDHVREDTGSIKIDWVAGHRDTFAFRYNIAESFTVDLKR